MTPNSNPTAKARRSYSLWFGISMIAYVVAIIVTRNFIFAHHLANPWLTIVAVLPVIPVIGIFAAIVRYVLATDELMRRMIVNASALAGGATALLAVTYGLIEGDGFPYLSAWWFYTVYMVSWMIAGFFVSRHYR